jgi:hypothetical protein
MTLLPRCFIERNASTIPDGARISKNRKWIARVIPRSVGARHAVPEAMRNSTFSLWSCFHDDELKYPFTVSRSRLKLLAIEVTILINTRTLKRSEQLTLKLGQLKSSCVAKLSGAILGIEKYSSTIPGFLKLVVERLPQQWE